MKKGMVGLSAFLLLSLVPAYSANPPKAGSACSKKGITKTHQGKKYTCIKSGMKLVWNKGVVVKRPTINVSPTPTLTPTPLPTSTPTSTANPTPPLSNETSSSSNDKILESTKFATADECKLKDGRLDQTLNLDHFERNNGFPLQGAILPTKGTVRFLTFFIDFSDAPGSSADMQFFRNQEKFLAEWFATASYGKLKAEIISVDRWFRAPKPSSDYVLKPNNYGMHPKLAQEFVDITLDSLDWKNIDAFLIHFPRNNKSQLQSAQLGRNVLISTPGGPRRLNYQFYGPWQYQFADAVKDKYPNYWAAQWIHENLHDLGLTLHAPGNGFNTGVGQSQASFSLSLSGWELFKLNWIDDGDIFCAPSALLNKSIVRLNSLENVGEGNRLVVIPLTNFQALVIESRRPLALSKDWPSSMSGIFVYRIDTAATTDRSEEFKGSGLDNGNNPKYSKWAFYLAPDSRKIDESLPASKINNDQFYKEWLIRPGESVTYSGVSIRFLKSDSQDFIEISKSR